MLRYGIPYQRYVRAGTQLYGTGKLAYNVGQRAAQGVYNAYRGAKYLKKTFSNNPSPPGSPKRRYTGGKRRSTAQMGLASKVQRLGSFVPRPGRRGVGPSGSSRILKSKYKKRKRSKKGKLVNMINGIESRVESIQKVRDLQAVYVGHSTFASEYVLFNICRAIVKAFWAKEGLNVIDDTTVGPNQINQFSIDYYNTLSAQTPLAYVSANIASNATFAQAVLDLQVIMRLAIDGYDKRQQFRTLTWYSSDLTTSNAYKFRHQCNMNTTKLSGYMRSMLTFQNATANATGNTVEGAPDRNNTDVNNANPIHIKKYVGNGNGTFWRNRTNTTSTYQSFIGNNSVGAISVVAAEATGKVLDEPPSSKYFMHAKQAGSFVLQPGNIKKAVLSTQLEKSITSYIAQHSGYAETALVRSSIGEFAFYGCEKVITSTVNGGASDVRIEIDVEIDYKTAFKCTLKGSNPTAPSNTEVVLAQKG